MESSTLFGFGQKSDLSARDKRYLAQVEKAIATFDSLDEWADYIAFLTRLQKALALPLEKPCSVQWIPLLKLVLDRLALCLSPLLPNGVHQKALGVYDAIFASLTQETLNSDISTWLPGLVSVISFGSMQVKPQLVALYENHLVKHLTSKTLQLISKPLILSLLPGLDDENSEIYASTLSLIDTLKLRLADNSHFWQTFFLCVIENPERRLGALNWCTSRLPVFETINEAGTRKYSAEAQACLSPDPGLLVRAFGAALHTSTLVNQASDIIVIRGFADLLISHLPLHSTVFSDLVVLEDLEILLMACCKMSVRKEMSLNRRLWNLLLGPDSQDDGNHDRKAYFEKYAFSVIEKGLLQSLDSEEPSKQIEAIRLCVSLTIEKWEISQLLTPTLFKPILSAAFVLQKSSSSHSADLLSASKSFFDIVETSYIWNYVIGHLILPGDLANIPMLEFVLKNFNLPQDEGSTSNINLAMLCFLLKFHLSDKSLVILELLADSFSPDSLLAVESSDIHIRESSEALQSLGSYYLTESDSDEHIPPIAGQELSCLLLINMKKWYIECLDSSSVLNERLASILCTLLYSVSIREKSILLHDNELKESVLSHAVYSPRTEIPPNTIFGIVKLCRYLVGICTPSEKSKLLRIVLSNLWGILCSLYPANHEVEAVKTVFDLQICFDKNEIEAGILQMILRSPERTKVFAFHKLWAHSTNFSDAHTLLAYPLPTILEGLQSKKVVDCIEVQKFIHSSITEGSANLLYKIITNPPLDFPIVQNERSHVTLDDDLDLFNYYLEIISSVIKSNKRLVKDSLSQEFVVSDSLAKYELIKTNGWEISSYKSLILCIIRKFLSLKIDQKFEENGNISGFALCVSTCLELYLLLVSGTEVDFDSHFVFLVECCRYFVTDFEQNSFLIEHVQILFLRSVSDFLSLAKQSNIHLSLLSGVDDIPELTKFIIKGISVCLSSILLENWFNLLTSTLYLNSDSIFDVLLPAKTAIIEKILKYHSSVKNFDRLDSSVDLESSINISLCALEDLLSISHSYLSSSNYRASNVPQGENGFLGNVILGVFQIESPLVKCEEQKLVSSVIFSFQDSIKLVFGIWYWADKKVPVSSSFASTKSINYVSSKLKFKSRKLLERLIELERHEVIETIIESHFPTEAKIKLLHVLDNGRTLVSLPHMLNSIITRCYPQALPEKERSSLYSSVTDRQLAEFLVSYYGSLDADSVDEVWEISVKFFRDVLSRLSNYKHLYIHFLHAIKVICTKARRGEGKGFKEMAVIFTNMLTLTVSKKSWTESATTPTPEVETENDLLLSLSTLVESMGVVLHDTEKVYACINVILSSYLNPLLKTKPTDKNALQLLERMGTFYPTKQWKQTIFDIFSDNSFFKEKHSMQEWKNCTSLWIASDKDKFMELVARVTSSLQMSASNIFIWNESSEVEDRVFVLKRITYLIMVQPKDTFSQCVDELFSRLNQPLKTNCPLLYKCEAMLLLRAVSLRCSENSLLSHWSFITQMLAEVFSTSLSLTTADFSNMAPDMLQLMLAASKLLDQLLILGFDEFGLNSWLFILRGSIEAKKQDSLAYMDKLASRTENMLSKEAPFGIQNPRAGEQVAPLLYGVNLIKNISQLKIFFGLSSYLNYERSFGLCVADFKACEKDVFGDI